MENGRAAGEPVRFPVRPTPAPFPRIPASLGLASPYSHLLRHFLPFQGCKEKSLLLPRSTTGSCGHQCGLAHPSQVLGGYLHLGPASLHPIGPGCTDALSMLFLQTTESFVRRDEAQMSEEHGSASWAAGTNKRGVCAAPAGRRAAGGSQQEWSGC